MPDELDVELAYEEGRRKAEVDIITALLGAGLHPQSIASQTNIPIQQIVQVLNVNLGQKVLTPEDQEIAAMVRTFAKRVLVWSMEMMDVAPLSVQVQIAKSVGPALGRMVGSAQGQSFEEAHQAFRELLDGQRGLPLSSAQNGPPPLTLPTDDSD